MKTPIQSKTFIVGLLVIVLASANEIKPMVTDPKTLSVLGIVIGAAMAILRLLTSTAIVPGGQQEPVTGNPVTPQVKAWLTSADVDPPGVVSRVVPRVAPPTDDSTP